MRHRSTPLSLRPCRELALLVAASLLWGSVPVAGAPASELRRTPVVIAVERARPSVVNIHGQKILRGKYEDRGAIGDSRRVNGMGTGVVIDERGYIITNFHVVDGVPRIQVTLADGKTYIARLVSHDQPTDLAIIKINAPKRIPVITIGTSKDLMVGEPAIAVGTPTATNIQLPKASSVRCIEPSMSATRWSTRIRFKPRRGSIRAIRADR